MEVTMRTAILIPARHASTRLPGKPLLRETGKYLIQHVYERACEVRGAAQVVVAPDDSRIAAALARYADLFVNLQGDEPLIDPRSLELLAGLMEADTTAVMATLAVPIRSEE